MAVWIITLGRALQYMWFLRKKSLLLTVGVMGQQLGSANTVITQIQHFLLLDVKLMCRFEWKIATDETNYFTLLCKLSYQSADWQISYHLKILLKSFLSNITCFCSKATLLKKNQKCNFILLILYLFLKISCWNCFTQYYTVTFKLKYIYF